MQKQLKKDLDDVYLLSTRGRFWNILSNILYVGFFIAASACIFFVVGTFLVMVAWSFGQYILVPILQHPFQIVGLP